MESIILTPYPLTSRYTPSVCMTNSLQSFPPFITILTSLSLDKFFHCLKSFLKASNQHLFGRPRLLFPSTDKAKICLVSRSLWFTCPNQCSLLHLNTESRLFSFSRLRSEFVLTRCFSWCCTTIILLLFYYAPNVSYLLVWGPTILMTCPADTTVIHLTTCV